MKILLVNDSLAEFGGAERSFHATAGLLRAHGHEVAELGSSGGESCLSFFTRWLSPKYFFAASRMIAEFKPDLIHCGNVTRIVSHSPLLAAAQTGIPVVLTLHDSHLFCARSWGITKEGGVCPSFSLRCLRRCRGEYSGTAALPYYLLKYLKVSLHRAVIEPCCSHFICPSRVLYEMLGANFPAARSRASLLPNFLQPSSAGAASRTPEPDRFLFVGRLTAAKGVDLILDAFARLSARGRKPGIDIIGDGPELQRLRSRAVDLGLAAQVTFHGKLPHEKLGCYYQCATALLAPSISIENNPLVVLEAQQHGCPVAAPRHAGFLDLIEHGQSGLFFENQNAAELAGCLEFLLSHPEEAARMGAEAKKRIEENLSAEAHYSKLIAIYQRVISNKRQTD